MTTDAARELDDALVMVHVRNAFYRGKFRFALGLYLLSIMVNCILISTIVYLLKHPTEPLFFPADKIGRLIHVIPLNQTNMPLPEVTNWAIEAVEEAYSYDFVNYRSQLQNAQKYFTEWGWREYMRSITASNNFKALTDRKFIIIAKVVAPPKLLIDGRIGNAKAWEFQMPVLVTYLQPPFNEKSRFSNPLTVRLTLRRQDVLQSYKGLAVTQLIANIASGSGQYPPP